MGDYQTVLESVVFNSASPNPSNDGGNPSRTLSWSVTDGNTGNGLSNIGISTLNVIASPHVVAGADVDYNVVTASSVVLDAPLGAFDGTGLTGATVAIAERICQWRHAQCRHGRNRHSGQLRRHAWRSDA